MTHPLVGRRVKLIAAKDVFPIDIFRPGLTGTIESIQTNIIAVKMDEPHEGLDQWDNELHWHADEIAPEDCLLNEFLAQVELI